MLLSQPCLDRLGGERCEDPQAQHCPRLLQEC
jgi:hypothetical protein